MSAEALSPTYLYSWDMFESNMECFGYGNYHSITSCLM